MADEIDITGQANAPKKVTGDEGGIEERSVDELIAADRYTKAQGAGASGPPHGLRISKIRFPGTQN